MNSLSLAEALLTYRLHRDMAAASLIDKLASAPPGTDSWRLDLTGEEKEILGRVLAENGQRPSDVEVEAAVAALTAKHLRSHLKNISREIGHAEASGDNEAIADLLMLKRLVQRALEGLEK